MSHLPEKLLNGYRSFMSGDYAGQSQRYRELAKTGQTPETMVIACCDSRAAPETIFDTGPGELFVVRNVANLVPPYTPDGEYHGTSAALEFAVQSLKVKDIVVLGHGRCGGIAAALTPDAAPLSPGDFIGKWMNMLVRPRRHYRRKPADDGGRAAKVAGAHLDPLRAGEPADLSLRANPRVQRAAAAARGLV